MAVCYMIVLFLTETSVVAASYLHECIVIYKKLCDGSLLRECIAIYKNHWG